MGDVSYSRFMQEIQQVIDSASENGQVVACRWIVHEVMQHHQDIVGGDASWYTYCGYEHTTAAVRRVIRDRKANEEEGFQNRQHILPGKEFMQISYIIKRDNESKVVPTGQCSDEELLAKIDEMRRQSRGLVLHADEIERFVEERRAAATASRPTRHAL